MKTSIKLRGQLVILYSLAGLLMQSGGTANAQKLPIENKEKEANVEKIVKKVKGGMDKSAKSQKKVEQISDDTEDLLTQIRNSERRTKSLFDYNQQLKELLVSQEEEMQSLREQINHVTEISREIIPIMSRMIDSLQAFIELDIPFLIEERRARIKHLRDLMKRADVDDSEKYRRITEAYEIENDYARTIETYKDSLSLDGKQQMVNFLRVGRVILVYVTLDGEKAGVWNQTNRSWKELPREYLSEIPKALRIARKQAAPDLIRLPVFAPEVTR
ncbi:MAG: DUF3450 domain-containing protein [Deltaproteobacteria bacterium]|nr:DUF3450 domain-containing protein [Deltaproteobacteria bacterium]